MKEYKKTFCFIISLQFVLIGMGAWQLSRGSIGFGMFNVLWNSVFVIYSIHVLRKMKKKDKRNEDAA